MSFPATEVSQTNHGDTVDSSPSDLSVQRLHTIVADLFAPKPWIFWSDFLVSAGLGWGAFAASLSAGLSVPVQLALLLVSGCALYRALAFIHELTHLRRGAVPGFRLVWNLICGIPLMIPDLMYMGVHLAHHSKRDYGTERDSEYLPYASRPKALLVAQVPVILLLPLIALLRFGLIAPLSLLSPRLRVFVNEQMSVIAMRMPYRRVLPKKPIEWRWWHFEETACCLLALACVPMIAFGLAPVELLVHWYAMATTIAVLNFVRGIGGTHRYRGDETEMTFAEQVHDSVNVIGNSPLTLVTCPVGLRYHALHHLFPAIPYHALGTAHRRLIAALPADSAYNALSVPGILAGFARLWRDAGTGVGHHLPSQQANSFSI